MLKEGSTSKYFFLGLIAVISLVGIIIIFPFITSIIAGAILAFLFHPFYNWMLKRLKSRGVAAFITAVIIILLVAVPTVLIINNLTKESRYLYIRTKQLVFSGQIIETPCYDDTFLCRTITDANSLFREPAIKNYAVNLLNDILTFVTKKVSDLIISLPKIAVYLMVVLFTTYYTLKDGEELLRRAEKVAPLKVHHQEQILKQFGDVTHAVIYGSFVVALVQGAFGALGFWLFGIHSFLWWAIIMTFFALIPFIGTWVVWFPASLYMGLTGYVQGESGMIWRGIGLFFYGLLIISTIDNIIKPVIVAGRARVHPLLILIGILGGLFTFGLIGLILGPLILALLQTLLEIYERERSPHIGEPEVDILGHLHNRKHGRRDLK